MTRDTTDTTAGRTASEPTAGEAEPDDAAPAPGSDRAHIRIEGLRKTFADGTVVAVEDLDLDVPAGELVVLLGPSGCGKTTTLRCIAGLETPEDGSIYIDGVDRTYDAPKDRDLAYVFQNLALFPHMSVRENIRFGLDMKTDYSAAEKNERVEEVASMLGLDGMLDRKPSALSGGQRQRVSIGRAVVMEPTAFLLDEPFANLDANLRDRMQTEVKKLQRRLETSMVFVTHDQEEAMILGDTVVVMRDGRIQQVADPHAIYNEPANLFVAEFIGSPSTNVLRGEVARGSDGLAFETGLFSMPLPDLREGAAVSPGDVLQLGVRPEYVTLSEGGGRFDATVEVVEPHGETDAVYLSAGDRELVATAPQGTVRDERRQVGVDFDVDRAWLFDERGDRVY